MAPPGGASPSHRRPEAEKLLRGQVEPPSGPPHPFRHSSFSLSPLSSLQEGPPSPAYRGERALPIEGALVNDQGQNSHRPSTSDRDAEGDRQFKDLLAKYKNVKRLYFDGKSQIERLTGQVEQLQNAVANQRLSQSRTSWDDGEYTTRFNRLNGAINNLAFNIRKDWSTLPAWLDKYVSADALKTGKQEMTAVGRAVISHWIVDDFFNTCFHPGLDPHLSSLLKEMELSLRDQSHLMQSQEELDALTTKVVNWRMATLDGLQKKLASSAAADNHANLINKTTESLTAYLHQHLSKPPPPGVEGSTLMIIELAVAIATNLPLESRDVVIMYPRPGDIVQPDLMEVDKTGLPAPGAQKTDGEGPDGDEVEVEMPQEKDRNGKERSEDAKSASVDDVGRVRFAGFMALEVKGRQVLIKAPVWTL